MTRALIPVMSALAIAFGTQLARAEAPTVDPLSQPVLPAPMLQANDGDNSDRGAPLTWKWRRFTPIDYAITVTGGALTLAGAIIAPREQHLISGEILFDHEARSALRASNLATRYQFRDASDVGLSLVATWPFFADALTTAWWYRGSRDVAEQMALIDLETLAVSGALQGITNTLVSRPRPYSADCGGELPSEAHDCVGNFHHRSFFSGHSAFGFTSAALICVHHAEHDLLGGPWDALSCAGGYAVAAMTATFRVVSDVHYASDVLTGALVGTLVGYGIPLLHYRQPALLQVHTSGVKMQVLPTPSGATIVGVF